MNLRNSVSVLATAIALTLVAYLIELVIRIPPTVAYFVIALLAAVATLLLAMPRSTQNRRHGAANGNKEYGNVKWFSPSKGFGFITRDNGEDVFVHFRSISGNGHRVLREGQRVEFAVTTGSKGPQAEDVVALK